MRFLLLTLLLSSLLTASLAQAKEGISLIRDTEIETTLRVTANPIFKAAGLKPQNVRIIVVNNPQINAFVAGGMNLFIHSGLLMEFDDVNVIQGVIAHETGHIAGGHLARGSERYKNASYGTALSYALGAAAALGGSPQAGMAIIAGGSHINQREILQFSRENEDAADQAGLTFLDRSHTSAQGLLELLQYLSRKEMQAYGDINPYILTHPLSRERVIHIRQHLETSPYKEDPHSKLEERYKRCYVKLRAYMQSPAATLKRYPVSDHSVIARYARAIAFYRQPDLEAALKEINGLIKEYPNDPYFYELKGQMLFEGSRVAEAIAPYEKAVSLMPDEPLLELGLAMAQIATADNGVEPPKPLLESATKHLLTGYRKEPANFSIIEQLVIAYGRQGQMGLSYLFQAEGAVLGKNKGDAKRFADLAKQNLPLGSPESLRANDILNNLNRKGEKGK